jgi:hypothetical protein
MRWNNTHCAEGISCLCVPWKTAQSGLAALAESKVGANAYAVTGLNHRTYLQ